MRVLAFSGGKDSMACLHLMLDTLDCAIYVDTGKSYPETKALVEYASNLVPMITVHADRDKQNEREGIPSDVVPIDWTRIGQMLTTKKDITVQSHVECCFENIAYPLLLKAKEIGATEIVYGQRNDEAHKSTARNGDIVEGIIRLQPIEDWSGNQVLAYLSTKMDVPEHYSIKHSSLDCYDCTAFRKVSHDRVAFTARRYPQMHREYMERLTQLNQAIATAMEY